MQVLIADDDVICREILATFLKDLGYEVIEAADGTQAWETLCGASPPRLIILDWMMPGMDGFEICRRVRRQMPDRGSYILLLTGSRMKQDIIKAVVAGADDYLIKPFEPMDLKIRLRAAQRILDLQAELDTRKTSD